MVSKKKEIKKLGFKIISQKKNKRIKNIHHYSSLNNLISIERFEIG